VIVTGDPERIAKSDRLVLPGVGSFKAAMETLKTTGMAESITQTVLNRNINILGICLGMQLLGTRSPEDGMTDGLSLFDGRTDSFNPDLRNVIKVPHIGFDTVRFSERTKLFKGMSIESDFYFVHEYRIKSVYDWGAVSTCNYGEEFVAAYENQNIFATQFHPEKSQANGLRVLNNFLEFPSC
jgi:glutamine amidotransferase